MTKEGHACGSTRGGGGAILNAPLVGRAGGSGVLGAVGSDAIDDSGDIGVVFGRTKGCTSINFLTLGLAVSVVWDIGSGRRPISWRLGWFMKLRDTTRLRGPRGEGGLGGWPRSISASERTFQPELFVGARRMPSGVGYSVIENVGTRTSGFFSTTSWSSGTVDGAVSPRGGSGRGASPKRATISSEAIS